VNSAAGTTPLKAPVRFSRFDATIVSVEVSQMDAKGAGKMRVVPAAEFTLRLKPRMTGETREVWVVTAEPPCKRLLVCTVGAATEDGIELVVQSVKRTVKS